MEEFFKPIQAIGSPHRASSEEKKIPFEKIQRAFSVMPRLMRSALLPTAMEPCRILSFLSTLSGNEPLVQPSKPRPHRSFLARRENTKYVPLGLKPCIPYSWLNPLMQLVLFLPKFSDAFHFLPRSMESLREFAEQYWSDQRENRSVSSADSGAVAHCLRRLVAPHLFRTWVHFYSLFLGVCELFSLEYPWKMVWDMRGGISLSHLLQKRFPVKAPEFLVCVQGKKSQAVSLIPRQVMRPDWRCYDLDAFIEYRPGAGFIIYLKSEGTWYQCDDERITLLRGNSLGVPLSRAVLLHYREILQGMRDHL